MDPAAANYNSDANTATENCFYLIYGCTNASASNYNPLANVNDGSCIPLFMVVLMKQHIIIILMQILKMGS